VGANAWIEPQQQIVRKAQESTSTGLTVSPYIDRAVLCTDIQETTSKAYRNGDTDFKYPSPKEKSYAKICGTPEGGNTSTNHTHTQQQIMTKNNTTVLPVSNTDTYRQEHSRRSVMILNRKTLTSQQANNNGNTTHQHTLQTLNKYQPSSVTKLTTLTKMTKPNTGTDLSNHRQHLSNTKKKGSEYNHRDLVTTKTNSFPKAYINGGKLTVGEKAVSPYKHLIPISIRILGTGNSNKSTNYDSVIVAHSILLALQYADSTARLVIWDYNGSENFATLPQVHSCSDITKNNIADFMEDPRVNQKNNSFSGRVCILTDYNLNKLKQNEEVMS
jgi:hypothetical protein